MNFLKILKETNIWKNYPACKELDSIICKDLVSLQFLYLSEKSVYLFHSLNFWVATKFHDFWSVSKILGKVGHQQIIKYNAKA